MLADMPLLPKLRSEQGKVVPICVGLVDVSSDARDRAPDTSKRFLACLLLIWPGLSLLSRRADVVMDVERLTRLRIDVEAQLKQMHEFGVLH